MERGYMDEPRARKALVAIRRGRDALVYNRV
jgi:hypothetical protein